MIAVGTPCYLTHLQEMPFNGRVVAVAGAPFIDDDGVERYPICAEWIDFMFPERGAVAQRSQLLPIIPPGIAPPEARDRKPEPVMNDGGI